MVVKPAQKAFIRIFLFIGILVLAIFLCVVAFSHTKYIRSYIENKYIAKLNNPVDYTLLMKSRCLTQEEITKRAQVLQTYIDKGSYQELVTYLLPEDQADAYNKKCGEDKYIEKYITLDNIQTDAVDYDSESSTTQSTNLFMNGDFPILFYPRELEYTEYPTKLEGSASILYAGYAFTDITSVGTSSFENVINYEEDFNLDENVQGTNVENRSVGVILFNAPNFKFGSPATIEDVRKTMFTDTNSVANYYRTVSMGNLNIVDAGVTDWLTTSEEIPLPKGLCPCNIRNTLHTIYEDFNKRGLLSKDILNADSLIFISSLDYSNNVGTCIPGGFANFGKDFGLGGKNRSFVLITRYYNRFAGPWGLIAHEIGHNNYFGHAKGLGNGYVSEYGNFFDVMGCAPLKHGPMGGSVGPLFLNFKGWKDNSNNFSKTVNLDNMQVNVPMNVKIKPILSNYPSQTGPFSLSLTWGKNSVFNVEYKSSTWVDKHKLLDPVGGVLLSFSSYNSYHNKNVLETYLIDPRPNTCNADTCGATWERQEFEDALLRPGDKYTYTFNNKPKANKETYFYSGNVGIVEVFVSSADNTEAEVVITLKSAPKTWKYKTDRTKDK